LSIVTLQIMEIEKIQQGLLKNILPNFLRLLNTCISI